METLAVIVLINLGVNALILGIGLLFCLVKLLNYIFE